MSNYLTIVQPGVIIGVFFVLCAGVVGISIYGARRGGRFRSLVVRNSGFALLGLGAVLTALYTLLPAGAAAPDRYVEWSLFGNLSQQIADAVTLTAVRIQLLGNVFLLAWLSLGLSLVQRSPRILGLTAWAFSASLLIELLQYSLNTGRVAAISDLVLNTLGGALVAWVGVRLLRPRLDRWSSKAERLPLEPSRQR